MTRTRGNRTTKTGWIATNSPERAGGGWSLWGNIHSNIRFINNIKGGLLFFQAFLSARGNFAGGYIGLCYLSYNFFFDTTD